MLANGAPSTDRAASVRWFRSLLYAPGDRPEGVAGGRAHRRIAHDEVGGLPDGDGAGGQAERRRVVAGGEGDRLGVSSIYRWYRDDFGPTDRDVINHLMAYAEPGLAMRLQRFDQISDDAFDWRLNDAAP